jgi:GNAT superfamily N-acetyltransferase
VLAALAPHGPVVGLVEAWTDPGVRLRHDAHFRLNVLSDWYGNGVGRNLAGRLEAWARGLGIQRLTTWTVAHNGRGLRFAERCGFRREVLIPDYAMIDGRSVSFVGLGKILDTHRL